MSWHARAAYGIRREEDPLPPPKFWECCGAVFNFHNADAPECWDKFLERVQREDKK